jgi:hypothetical protein
MSGGGASFNCRFFSTEISAIVYMGSAALMWLLAAWAEHASGFCTTKLMSLAGRWNS